MGVKKVIDLSFSGNEVVMRKVNLTDIIDNPVAFQDSKETIWTEGYLTKLLPSSMRVMSLTPEPKSARRIYAFVPRDFDVPSYKTRVVLEGTFTEVARPKGYAFQAERADKLG